MDPLSDIVALLRPSAILSKPITGRGRWGAAYQAYRQPSFAIMLEGHCWLELEGAEPVCLQAADFVLLPATPAFRFYSAPDVTCIETGPSDRPVHHGEPGLPDFRMLGGGFEVQRPNAPLIADLLPRMIHITAADGGAERLGTVVTLLRNECESDRPGREAILDRLLEVMLIECLRHTGIDGNAAQAGLLAAMRDPALSRVLQALHDDVRRGWTVAELARHAGMSRSVLAARFQQSFGCGPIEYLARWRMALARHALIQGTMSLERLADQIGYQSASAFSTAFRKRHGSAPRAYALGNRAGDGRGENANGI